MLINISLGKSLLLNMLTKTRIDVTMRVTGSVMVIVAYFVVLHVNTFMGVIMHTFADAISVPYFVRTKSWDVVLMLGFLLCISASKLWIG